MDSTSASQAAASSQPIGNDPSLPLPKTDQPNAATSGFSLPALEFAAALLECVNHGCALDREVKHVVHIPRAREHLTRGFELLSSMQGNLFGMLCHQLNYSMDEFYIAAERYRQEQRAAAETAEMARLAGMTVEEFAIKLKAASNETKN